MAAAHYRRPEPGNLWFRVVQFGRGRSGVLNYIILVLDNVDARLAGHLFIWPFDEVT